MLETGNKKCTILASLELITEFCELEDSSQDVGREEIKHAGGKISIYIYIRLFKILFT